jgi:hypothetical protein
MSPGHRRSGIGVDFCVRLARNCFNDDRRVRRQPVLTTSRSFEVAEREMNDDIALSVCAPGNP